MGYRQPFRIDPKWPFSEFLQELYAYYVGGGIQSTGYRLNMIRAWISMAGRLRAVEALCQLERESGTCSEAEIAESLWMSRSTYRALKKFAASLPEVNQEVPPVARPIKAFISYKWDSGAHVAWVRKFAAALRACGVEAILDQWEVRFGESFTDYMQRHIADADVILFVITPDSVAAAEAPAGKGGALKFEVQMMNARRTAEGVRIIGVYRSGDRPPHYLRDNRYADFRDDTMFDESLSVLVQDLLGKAGPPPIKPLNLKEQEK